MTEEAPREGMAQIKTIPGPTPGAEADPLGDPGLIQPGMSTEEIMAAGVRVEVPFELPPTGTGMEYDGGPPGEPLPPDFFEKGNAAWQRIVAGNDDSAAGAAANEPDDAPPPAPDAPPALPAKPPAV